MGSVVRQHWKPVLLLMVLSPLLAEIISGATQATLFFLPWIFFPYATILYGFPVLVIREVAVRGKLGSGTAQTALAVVFGALTGNIMWAMAGAIFTTVFIGGLRHIKRKPMASLDGRDA